MNGTIIINLCSLPLTGIIFSFLCCHVHINVMVVSGDTASTNRGEKKQPKGDQNVALTKTVQILKILSINWRNNNLCAPDGTIPTWCVDLSVVWTWTWNGPFLLLSRLNLSVPRASLPVEEADWLWSLWKIKTNLKCSPLEVGTIDELDFTY